MIFYSSISQHWNLRHIIIYIQYWIGNYRMNNSLYKIHSHNSYVFFENPMIMIMIVNRINLQYEQHSRPLKQCHWFIHVAKRRRYDLQIARSSKYKLEINEFNKSPANGEIATHCYTYGIFAFKSGYLI